MNLGVSIANLLRRYPAVGVPGIGVFKRTRHPASYDADKAAFLPPSDHVELVDNASDVFLLTTYLKVQEQLDGAAAEAKLEGAVAAIMDTISRNGEALLDGLGYLLADGASFIFKPFEIVDGSAAKPIAAQPPAAGVPDEVVTPVDEGTRAVDETGPAPDAVAEESAEQASALDAGGEERGGKRYALWIVGGTIAALLIAAVAVWRYQPAWFGVMFAEQLAVAQRDSVVSPEPSRALVPLVDSATTDSLIADTSMAVVGTDSVDHVPETNVPPTKLSVTYEIIVGSFATMRQADKFVADMKAKGYELHAIDSRMPGNRKKISWGSYATEEEAYKELARVQKTFEPGAWIAKISHE